MCGITIVIDEKIIRRDALIFTSAMTNSGEEALNRSMILINVSSYDRLGKSNIYHNLEPT